MRSIAANNAAMDVLDAKNANDLSCKLADLIHSETLLSFDCQYTQGLAGEIFENIERFERRAQESGKSFLDRLTYQNRYWRISKGICGSEFKHDLFTIKEKQNEKALKEGWGAQSKQHIWRILIPYIGMEPFTVYCSGPAGLRGISGRTNTGDHTIWGALFDDIQSYNDVLHTGWAWKHIKQISSQDKSAEAFASGLIDYLENGTLVNYDANLFQYYIYVLRLAKEENNVRQRDTKCSDELARRLFNIYEYSKILKEAGIKDRLQDMFEVETLIKQKSVANERSEMLSFG